MIGRNRNRNRTVPFLYLFIFSVTFLKVIPKVNALFDRFIKKNNTTISEESSQEGIAACAKCNEESSATASSTLPSEIQQQQHDHDHDHDHRHIDKYGVDSSFPIHSIPEFQSSRNTFGHLSGAQQRYNDFMESCRSVHGDAGHRCDKEEQDRLAQNREQPSHATNYTSAGYTKLKIPPQVWELLQEFYQRNKGKEHKELWKKGDIHTNSFVIPTYSLNLWDDELDTGGDELAKEIFEWMKPILEEWAGVKLKPVSLYGIRIYKEGSILSPHADRHPLITSAIMNIDQDTDEDWPLEVYGRDGMARNISMVPGDLVLYESHSLIHGRPFPLKGRFYANAFIHYEPVGPDYDESKDKNLPYSIIGDDDEEDEETVVVQEEEEEEEDLVYGVDTSFPMHDISRFESSDNILGGDAQDRYHEFLQGCRKAYPDIADKCDQGEYDRVLQNKDQPAQSTNYTESAYRKVKVPPKAWELIRQFWNNNEGMETVEKWGRGNIFTNHWASPTYKIELQDTGFVGGGSYICQQISESVQMLVEEWTQQRLRPVSQYGIRLYKRNSILSPHVDRHPLVASAIINVAQEVEEEWPLEVIDRDGRARNITMEPGDLVLYESHSLIHGRPFPLKGRYFANIFIHFEPIGPLHEECVDTNPKCSQWARDGECEANDSWMLQYCPFSCHVCNNNQNNDTEEEDWDGEKEEKEEEEEWDNEDEDEVESIHGEL